MDWIIDNYPGWRDVGRQVEVELEDGLIVIGYLGADDWYDVPIFEIRTDVGVTHSFAANKRWRFVEP